MLTIPSSPIHAGIFPDEPAAEIDLDKYGVVDIVIPGSNSQINAVPQGSNRILSFDQFGTLYAADLSDGSFIGAVPTDAKVWGGDTPPPVMAACFNAGGVFCDGNFLGGIEFLGAEFDIAGNTHYGWLEIRSQEGFQSIDVLSWAYETEPGAAILAGAIPEPSAAVLAMFATLLISRRKRK